MSGSLSANAAPWCLEITMAEGEVMPIEHAWDLEGEVVVENGSKPGVDDSAATGGGGGGTMNDLRASEANAVCGTRTRLWIAPFFLVLCGILCVAVRSGASRILGSS